MLRIILWKIGIEWAHLLRALWPRADRRVYYFAFGANLASSVLERRRIEVFESFDYALENSGLRFSQPGFYQDHGYASADAVQGEFVYGRMYQILERDALRMDYFEGVPFFRAHDKVFQQGQDFEFFFYRTTRVVDGLKPTREYLDYLLEAYRQMPLVPQAYREQMATTPVLEQLLPLDQVGIFVRDIDRWPGWLRPQLLAYERGCMKVVEFIWHRSLLQCLIRF